MTIQKEVTLRVFGETESEVDAIINVLKLILSNPHIGIYKVEDKQFDWNAQTVIAENEEDLTPYYEIADRLYTRLLGDNGSFSDWEYRFVTSNYEVAEAKGYYTPKQKEWLKKLEEKYL